VGVWYTGEHVADRLRLRAQARKAESGDVLPCSSRCNAAQGADGGLQSGASVPVGEERAEVGRG